MSEIRTAPLRDPDEHAGRALSDVVVCGVDGRDPGQRDVVRVAIDLAEQLDARLLLVHVAPPVSGPGTSTVVGAAEELRRIALARADELLVRLVEDLDGDAEHRAAIGDPAVELARIARDEGAALVVVGNRGRHRVVSALFGSVTAELGRIAPCPVVVVTADATARVPALA